MPALTLVGCLMTRSKPKPSNKLTPAVLVASVLVASSRTTAPCQQPSNGTSSLEAGWSQPVGNSSCGAGEQLKQETWPSLCLGEQDAQLRTAAAGMGHLRAGGVQLEST